MRILTFVLALGMLLPQFSTAQDKEITLRDIWASGKFRAQSVYGIRSMKDGLHYTTLEDDRGGSAIAKWSYETGEKVAILVGGSEIVPVGQTKPIEIQEYTFSADESKVLVATDIEPIYRHSTRESNYVYDLNTKKVTMLTAAGKQRYATFSPDGSKVAFVRQNNIYIKDLVSGNETAVTKDGSTNNIIYGATDWVYEEEFGFDKAFFWAPDGKTIAFYRFVEQQVPEFTMDMFGELYPEPYTFRYPKAGETNSTVNIMYYNLQNGSTGRIAIPKEYEYIPRIKWTSDPNILCVQSMPRLQNSLTFWLADVRNGELTELLNETSDTYVEVTDDLHFLKNKAGFIRTSEKGGYNHLYRYDMKGQNEKQLTSGEWDITSVSGVDEANGLIYYMSAEASPMERDLYTIKLNGKSKKKLSTRKGNNRAVFSEGFKYHINYNQSANTPNYVSLHDASGKMIRELVSNETLVKTLESYGLSQKEFFSFTTPDGVTLNGSMIKPRDFNPAQKYPVLMHVYGGPGIQTVRETSSRNDMWHHMLTQKGYIVVSVDNRGTGARGAEFKKCTYAQLGALETEDQMHAARWLGQQSYVDASRIGIWGWSYGGYMSSLCISKGANLFKAAIAVAPVTNWRYYDTIYTERYMKTPDQNPDGYDVNSPIHHVGQITGKYLLVHGMADDNVHFQNTVEMVDALTKANVQFDLAIYPNKNHSIYGGNTRLHLFTKMTDFILENL